MLRFSILSRQNNSLRDMHPNDIISLVRREEINGEHSLEIESVGYGFDVGSRVVYQDNYGKWREYVVYGTEKTYKYGSKDVYKSYCVWAIQHDLEGTVVSSMPGVQNPVSASAALDAALSGTHRWVRGTVDVTTTAGASMYRVQGWQAMSTLLKHWGGELDATIEVSVRRVETRKADLLQHIGSTTVTHRFDLGYDIKSIKRTQEDGPLFCRIMPLGKGEQSGDGYGRKITIESVNGGKTYLEYRPMVNNATLPYKIDDTLSGVEYPTLIVENPECETPADLKAWAEENLAAFCTPKISYKVDVMAAMADGLDLSTLQLGDVVNVRDELQSTNSDALMLEARVVAMEVDELTGTNTNVTIGSITENLSNSIGSMESRLTATENALQLNEIKYVDVALGNKTIGSGGYVDITSSIPSDVRQYLHNGGILVSTNTIRWTNNTNAVVPVVYKDGSKAYLMGAPNVSITNLTIRICYI